MEANNYGKIVKLLSLFLLRKVFKMFVEIWSLQIMIWQIVMKKNLQRELQNWRKGIMRQKNVGVKIELDDLGNMGNWLNIWNIL